MSAVDERADSLRETTVETMPEEDAGTKAARFQARLSTEQKDRLQQAASLEGQTLTDFVIDSALRRAEAIIRDAEVMHLSGRDSRAFVEALLSPPPPSARMRDLVTRYQREVEER